MSEKSKIEWCDSTFNPWTGCTKVSPGCDHCYAERWNRRFAESDHAMHWGAGKPRRRTSAANWKQPQRWNRQDFFECSGCGFRGTREQYQEYTKPPAIACCPDHDLRPARRRVFCASLADVFDNEAPAEWRRDLLNLIAGTPRLDWLVLTKRIGNARAMLNDYAASDGHRGDTLDGAWPNLWIGATVCNQQEFQRDVPKLLQTPGAVRFISAEPLLGPIDMDCVPRPDAWPAVVDDICDGINPLRYLSGPQIDWVIAGGESGPGARPAHPDWFRAMRDECVAMRVPFLFKQWGDWIGLRPEEPKPAYGVRCHEWNGGVSSWRVGKHAAGRMLDGRTWNEFPQRGPSPWLPATTATLPAGDIRELPADLRVRAFPRRAP